MLANWARLLAVATMPTIDIRNISGADAPARLTISPVVKKRLNAGATCATPGMMTPNRPSWLVNQLRCRAVIVGKGTNEGRPGWPSGRSRYQLAWRGA